MKGKKRKEESQKEKLVGREIGRMGEREKEKAERVKQGEGGKEEGERKKGKIEMEEE